ncbi:MAG TPA: TIGR01777 family oxidoreductase [Pyrinomonadaceae bacterium]|nr:TIGR01777 family oxidoreductase [Pyrinomonadaceae bacterium]
MRVIITGASGLIGSALVRSLVADGHEVTRVGRGGAKGSAPPGVSDVRWNPEQGSLPAEALEGHDAAVHLAGEPVGEGRWTEEKKRRIRESRAKGTRLLSETLAGLKRKPRSLVSASATGFYGDRGDEVLTEASAPGTDFLSKVCREWEAAARPAAEAGIRVAHPRIGVVLDAEGGALPKMLTPFRLGLGGKLGDGRQYMSWITLADVVRVVRRLVDDDDLSGPFNAVAPRPVTNAEFTRALGRVLGRPTVFFVPKFAARLAFGETADALLLSSQRAEPARLNQTDFRFEDPEIEGALRRVLKG